MKKLTRKRCYLLLLLIASILLQLHSAAQPQAKEVNSQSQSWISFNSTTRLYKNFGLIADIHVRRNNFMADPGFNFIRIGANYWLRENTTAGLGYGQMWVAPGKPGWHYYAQEHRIYQQIQMTSKIGNTRLLNRLRNEQRWQQKIVNDKFANSYKFTERIRYLLNITIPLFKNPIYPALVISDELSIQFGREVIYNTFDQNRAFIGIKQQITKSFHFDFGYMLVYQQKASGYQYDKNKTLRCFFYYMPDVRSKNK